MQHELHEPNRPETGFFAGLVRHPVTLFVLFITLMVIGVIAYVRIPLQMMPDGIVEPGLQVYAIHPGSSAEENEEQVARILEEELRTIAGIGHISSNSSDDQVGISVQFDADTDMDLAKAEVRDRIERARPKLPKTVREIGIWSWSNADMPVMFFAILHPGDSARTDFLIDTVIKRRLEAVDGIGRLELWGVLDDSVRIELDEDRVRAAGLDLGALIARLSADNFAMPMGEVTDGGRRVLLRSDMRFTTKQQIEAYPIERGLVLSDIGRVIDAKSVRNRLFRMDQTYAYFGEVQKEAQANVVEVCHRVKAVLDELQADPRLKGEFKFLVFFNQGEFIEGSVAQLADSAYTGGLLSILILFLFLPRVRLTLCMAMAIPVSVLIAIAWVFFTGGTFNVLTMAGITLAMGMLVDNAVVVVENITRLRDTGLGPMEAAARGTREVALAVFLSTMTTVVVFLPMIFMGENPTLRIMFGALGLPLCVSLVASLLAALIFLPVITARVIGPRHALTEKIAGWIAPIAGLPALGFNYLLAGLRIVFFGIVALLHAINQVLLFVLVRLWLRWVLAVGVVVLVLWRGASILQGADLAEQVTKLTGSPPGGGLWTLLSSPKLIAAAALVALAVLVIGMGRWAARPHAIPARPAHWRPAFRGLVDGGIALNHSLLEWTLANRFWASLVSMLVLASVIVPQTNMKMAAFGEDENTERVRVEVDLENNFTLEQAEHEMGHYEQYFAAHKKQYGFEHMACRFDKDGGRIDAYWEGRRTREDRDLVLKDLRLNLHSRPGHTMRIGGDDSADARNRNMVTFRLVGPESEELSRLGQEAVHLLEAVPGLTDVKSPLADAPEQVRVVFDSDLAHLMGVTPQNALQNVAWALRGWELPRFQEPGREVPLIIEYDEEQAAGLSTLRDLEIRGGKSAVPLSTFSSIEYARASRSIQRFDGKTSFEITARVDDPMRQRELSDLGLATLAGMDFPRGYSVGEDDLVSARQDSEMKEIYAALMLSVVLVFLLMGVLFESFLLPISVLFTIPFAIVGALWTMYVTHTAMDSVGWIGVIILVGVVVNNGIVLIDRIHQLRKEGMERTAAILEGSANRVRPVLITALTTVVGLLPMALTEPPGEGIDYRALATCVAGGMSISTIFTLWVVPLAYSLLDDLRIAFAARVVHWRARRGSAAPAEDSAAATI
ncbi:MAG TPA: efflux RND transporter permease subunit [Planctomycetota bacterium]|nr:efflux RND transporter permease subunit [Planctomycetota bacterium]